MKRILTTACMLVGSWVAVGEAAGPATPDQVDLRYVYFPGRVTRQRMVSRTVGSIKLFDPLPEQKFSQTFEQEVTMKCRKVNADKSSVVDMTMDRMAMKMSIAGMNLEFDSKSPATQSAAHPGVDVLEKVFSAMVGSTFTMTIGGDGQPIKVEGVKEMMKRVSDRLSDEKMPAAMKKMFDQMSNLFADDNMMQDMQSCHRIIPCKGPIRVGDKWDRKWDMKMPMFNAKIEGEGQYELLGIGEFRGRPCAKIGVKESFRMISAAAEKASDATASAPAKGIWERLRFDLKASGGDGTAYWDYQDGNLVQLRQTQRMTIEISFAPDANADETEMKKGAKMVQKLNTSVSVDLIDDAEAAGGERAAPAPASESATEQK